MKRRKKNKFIAVEDKTTAKRSTISLCTTHKSDNTNKEIDNDKTQSNDEVKKMPPFSNTIY